MCLVILYEVVSAGVLSGRFPCSLSLSHLQAVSLRKRHIKTALLGLLIFYRYLFSKRSTIYYFVRVRQAKEKRYVPLALFIGVPTVSGDLMTPQLLLNIDDLMRKALNKYKRWVFSPSAEVPPNRKSSSFSRASGYSLFLLKGSYA